MRSAPDAEHLRVGEHGADELVIAAFDAPVTVDPHAAFDSGSRHVVLNVYESLLRVDADQGFAPWLATEIERSEDGRTYRLKMAPGIEDHQGEVLTATDAQYSIRRSIITAPGPGSLWLTALLGRDGSAPVTASLLGEACRRVEAAGQEVQITLAQPFEPLTAIIAQWALVMSRSWAVSLGAWPGDLDSIQGHHALPADRLLATTNGSGPYVLEHFQNEPPRIAFVRNRRYWREVTSPARVTLVSIQDRVERECALLEGSADYAVCQPESLERLKGATGVIVEQTRDEWHVNPLGTLTYQLADDAPALDTFPRQGLGDIHLRRALSLAFDYARFTREALNDDPLEHPGPFPAPALPGGPRPPYRFDLDAAKEELRLAWGGSAAERGFELPVYTHRDNYAREVAAAILVDGFNQMDARCRLVTVAQPFDQLLENLFAGRCPIAWISWDADYVHPHAFAHELLSPAAMLPRCTGMRLPGAEDLLSAALEAGREKAMSIYRRLAQAAIDECCYLFVPGKVSYLNYSARWQNVRLFPGASNVLDFTSFARREPTQAPA